MIELIQEYSTDNCDIYGHNLFLSDELCEIKINLGSLMDRKNMSTKKLAKKINSFFLLEFTCAILHDEGLWTKSICEDGFECNIKKTLKKLNYFLW